MSFFGKYAADLKSEFRGYNASKLSKDILAGVTVTAVALPLALAFGVSSGASAAAGLITAIIAGLVMGTLSGAEYQISGPTGSMCIILAGVAAKFSMQGMLITGMLAGAILLIAGVLKLGRVVKLIPPVIITGFTSGIALVIALSQYDNFFGVQGNGAKLSDKLLNLVTNFNADWRSIAVGLLVIAIIATIPKKISSYFPSSLIALILVSSVCALMKIDIPKVGEIPATLLLGDRLILTAIPWDRLPQILLPAVSIAALVMIESLLCGSAAVKMREGLTELDANRELIAQGIGNMILPFFGGIPAVAAVSRTSVAIKSGSATRLTSIIHALGLLASMFILGSVMSQIPLSALAGTLMVTAWRMNDWTAIKAMFKERKALLIAQYAITMVSTAVLNLIAAIIIGTALSMIIKYAPVLMRKLKRGKTVGKRT